MRKLKLQVQTSIDGYMAGPGGEPNFMTFPWSTDLEGYVIDLMASVDTIVLGRTLAEGFIPAWAAGPPGESPESIAWMNDTPKVVISQSLTESPWENAVVAGGDAGDTIRELKAQEGGDLIVYGGGTLVRSLIAEGLVDDLHLFVNTAAVGQGMPVFPRTDEPLRMQLAEARGFDCGIAVLHYRPAAG